MNNAISKNDSCTMKRHGAYFLEEHFISFQNIITVKI